MNKPVRSQHLGGQPTVSPRDDEGYANERLFLTAVEVGGQLGLRKSRVYELAAAGLLPTVRLGRRLLFPRRGSNAPRPSASQRSQLVVGP